MDQLRTYPTLVFFILGFIFYGQFMNVFILAVLWEFIEGCLDKGISSDNMYQHFTEYQNLWKQDKSSKQNKLVDLGTNLGSYYVGHYIRNKLPL